MRYEKRVTNSRDEKKGFLSYLIPHITHPSTHPQERGFAMLFAVLVSSVLLSIGISIFNLTVKDLLLSSSGRESQFAFYAADTGVECALYWDFRGANVFATSTDDTVRTPSDPDCVNTLSNIQPVDVTNYISRTPTTAVTRFEITIPNLDANGDSAPYCAIVTVTKSAAVAGGVIETTIDSRGYNTSCDSTNAYRVERALQVTY